MNKPIILSTWEVQAIADGRKTMLRSVMKRPPCPEATRFVRIIETVDCGVEARFGNNYSAATCDRKLPYQVGAILWCKETWCPTEPHFGRGPWPKFYYRADSTPDGERCRKEYGIQWRSPVIMPKEAARLFLMVTDVRVERLQDISEDDAKAEGIEYYHGYDAKDIPLNTWDYYRRLYINCWDDRYAKKGVGWDANTWVFVYAFEKCEKPAEWPEKG